MEVAELKAKWVGVEFDSAEFEVKAERMLEFAAACGETEGRFCDTTDPDFQAVPTFTSQFHGRRMFPEGFPSLGGFGRAFDAGKCVIAQAPIRLGDRLTAKSRIHDIYEKTGRSGHMTFIVHRMEFSNQDGELVSIVDWRMLQKSG